MMRWLVGVVVAAMVTTLWAAVNAKRITKDQYGDKWPFTADSVELQCEPATARTQFVTVKVGKHVYALNGTAKATKKYKTLEDIWRKHPDPAMAKAGLRVNVGEVLQDGLKLCQP